MTVSPINHPADLHDVEAAFQSTLHMPDLGALHVVLATVAGNRMSGDPIWTMLIGPPSSGKTEIVASLGDLADIHEVSTTTKAGILSGSTAAGGTGGLLFEIGSAGIIVFKDLTTLLSEPATTRNEVLAILREVYDGRVDRALGSGGGQRITWRGHAGCIACSTEAVDTVDLAAFGERWMRYRLSPLGDDDRFLSGLSVFENQGLQRDRRDERARVVSRFFSSLEIPDRPPSLTAAEEDRLITLSELGTRCRSAVVRDGWHRDVIEQVPAPEELPRLLGQLSQLSAGLSPIGVDDGQRWRLLTRCALDGMSSMRRHVLDVLIKAGSDLATSSVAGRCALPPTSVRRHLQDLAAQGVVRFVGDDPERWQISSWTRERWWATTGFASDYGGGGPEA
jgi:hypothetical protein